MIKSKTRLLVIFFPLVFVFLLAGILLLADNAQAAFSKSKSVTASRSYGHGLYWGLDTMRQCTNDRDGWTFPNAPQVCKDNVPLRIGAVKDMPCSGGNCWHSGWESTNPIPGLSGYTYHSLCEKCVRQWGHCNGYGPEIRQVSSGWVNSNHVVAITNNNLESASVEKNFGPINFSFSSSSTFNAGNGMWDTPIAKYCSSLNNSCFGSLANPSAYVQAIQDRWGNQGRISWTGVMPGVEMESSDSSVISCSGMTCTPKKAGAVTLTAKINETNVRLWSYLQFSCTAAGCGNFHWRRIDTNDSCYLHEGDDNGTVQCENCTSSQANTRLTNKMTLPAKSVSWNFTVTDPTTTIGGRVIEDGGGGIDGVAIQGYNGDNITTVNGGYWEQGGVPIGWSGLHSVRIDSSTLPAGYVTIYGTSNNSCHPDYPSYEWQLPEVSAFKSCSDGPVENWDLPIEQEKNFNFTVNYPPEVNLKVNSVDGPITISYNTPVSLSWSSSNVEKCKFLSGSFDQSTPFEVPTAGNKNSTNLRSKTEFKIKCYRNIDWTGLSKEDTVIVNVTLPVPPKCGLASRNYSCNETEYSGDFCKPGIANPLPPPFPELGQPSKWKCLNDGLEKTCPATKRSCGSSNWKE